MILFIITVIWDMSGFITSITKYLYEYSHEEEWGGQQLNKIFSCSYCVKFHSVWIYLLIAGNTVLFSFFIASLSTFIGVLLIQLLNRLTDLIHKI